MATDNGLLEIVKEEIDEQYSKFPGDKNIIYRGVEIKELDKEYLLKIIYLMNIETLEQFERIIRAQS